MFHSYEVPVAYSMVGLLRHSPPQTYEPFQEFMFLWMAFNNIYTTLADHAGRKKRFKTKDGSLQTRLVSNLVMPRIEGPTEREELEIAYSSFDEDLKHRLITHENTSFFVYRSPMFHGRRIEFDIKGQRVNGVLNVGHTIDERHPIWSPIDTTHYERYIRGNHDVEIRNPLANQIFNVLYTVRCNTFHGGKNFDDRNDREVLERATPLLSLIVMYFLSD